MLQRHSQTLWTCCDDFDTDFSEQLTTAALVPVHSLPSTVQPQRRALSFLFKISAVHVSDTEDEYSFLFHWKKTSSTCHQGQPAPPITLLNRQ